jgi:hypothetical protein
MNTGNGSRWSPLRSCWRGRPAFGIARLNDTPGVAASAAVAVSAPQPIAIATSPPMPAQPVGGLSLRLQLAQSPGQQAAQQGRGAAESPCSQSFASPHSERRPMLLAAA